MPRMIAPTPASTHHVRRIRASTNDVGYVTRSAPIGPFPCTIGTAKYCSVSPKRLGATGPARPRDLAVRHGTRADSSKLRGPGRTGSESASSVPSLSTTTTRPPVSRWYGVDGSLQPRKVAALDCVFGPDRECERVVLHGTRQSAALRLRVREAERDLEHQQHEDRDARGS